MPYNAHNMLQHTIILADTLSRLHAGGGRGSVPVLCQGCGHDAWIGPRQQRMRAAFPILPVLCAACAADLAASEPEISLVVLTAGRPPRGGAC